ncbi:MFS transporter [Burkholderia guangdongensis]|uniref:MFS transporter n=1 Tax=Burkholderia guangdongensis TaxID=1792500 RepID=UPI0015CB9DA4|nr:MFS transporter [Burkholderia guangdongensis]
MNDAVLLRWKWLCYLQGALALEAFSAPVLVLFYTSYAGFTIAEYTTIISLIFVFLWWLEIPMGALADRYGRKNALVAGNVVYLAAMACLVAFGHAVSPWLVALLFACGGALATGAFQGMMFDAFAQSGRDADFHAINARATSLSMLGSGAAAVAGGWLAARSLALPMVVDIGVLGALTLALAVWLEEPARRADIRRASVAAIVRDGVIGCVSNRPLMAAMLIAAAAFACLRAGFNFYQPLLRDSGTSVETIGWIFAAMYGCSSLMAYLFSHIRKSTLVSKWPPIMLVLLLAVAAAALAVPGASASTAWILFAIACHQLVRGMVPSYTAYLINRCLPPHAANRTTILSGASLVRAVWAALLVWSSGLAAESIGSGAAFVLLSAISAVVIAAICYFRTDAHETHLAPHPPGGD